MSVLADLVEARGIAILDGGLATELEHRGCCIEGALWSARVLIEQPEEIARVHADYLRAGSDIITSATYQATPQGLQAHGLDAERSRQVMQSAMVLANHARDQHQRESGRRALVAASIGSYGAYLADGSEYRGDYGVSRQALAAFHRERLELLAPHADILAFETIPSLCEIEALTDELTRLGRFEAWVSLSCPAGDTVGRKDAVPRCVDILHGCEHVSGIGINCLAPALATPLVERIASLTDKVVLVYPNSGEAWNGSWRGAATSPTDFSTMASTWAHAGARVIGGCCRTSPAHVRALASWRDTVVRAGLAG